MKKRIACAVLVILLVSLLTPAANAASRSKENPDSLRKMSSVKVLLLLKLEDRMRSEQHLSKQTKHTLWKLKNAHYTIDPKFEAFALYVGGKLKRDARTEEINSLLDMFNTSYEILNYEPVNPTKAELELHSNARILATVSSLKLMDEMKKKFAKQDVVSIKIVLSYADISLNEGMLAIELQNLYKNAKDEKNLSSRTQGLIKDIASTK